MQNGVAEVFSKMTEYFEREKYRRQTPIEISYELVAVPSHYYEQSLEWRAQILKAPNISYLCKTILLENTSYDPQYASPVYPRFVCVVIQYISKISSEKVMKWARGLNQQNKVGKTKFHFRLADEEVAFQLTGYRYNALTPYLMNQNIPLVISNSIVKLPGRFFWIGGGHVDLKLRLSIQECVNKYPDAVYFADIVNDNDFEDEL